MLRAPLYPLNKYANWLVLTSPVDDDDEDDDVPDAPLDEDEVDGWGAETVETAAYDTYVAEVAGWQVKAPEGSTRR